MNKVINRTVSASRMVNSDTSNSDLSIFNNIDFCSIDFLLVAKIIDLEKLSNVNILYDQYTQSMELVTTQAMKLYYILFIAGLLGLLLAAAFENFVGSVPILVLLLKLIGG